MIAVAYKLNKNKAIYLSEIKIRESLATSPLETFENIDIEQLERKYGEGR